MKKVILTGLITVVLSLLIASPVGANSISSGSSKIQSKYYVCTVKTDFILLDYNNDGVSDVAQLVIIRGARDGSLVSYIFTSYHSLDKTVALGFEEWNYKDGWLNDSFAPYSYPVPVLGTLARYSPTYPYWQQ